MDQPPLLRLLDAVANGSVTAAEAAGSIASIQPEPARRHARVDLHRQSRTGIPEVVYAPSKTEEQIRSVSQQLLKHSTAPVIITRASEGTFDAVRDLSPEATWHEMARAVVLRRDPTGVPGSISIVTAGTSDVPVAEEAAVTAEACGTEVDRVYDVGVAGLHRVLGASRRIRSADVVIVVAGMEGALPSVVGGLVQAPIVAVPTSVGYGASFGGLAALLGMLNSCAPGVGVVNIDNGFGAAAFAIKLLRARGGPG